MAAPSLSLLLGAWRSLLCKDGVFARDGVGLFVSRHPSPPLFAVRHCGELQVYVRTRTDAAVVAKRLGELLRVVALTTASHVDPSVFNALWDENGLCPMGASRCPRCDASDRHDSRPILRLTIQGQYRIRSGVGILHDAIYNWDEATDSSAEYKQLREMLHIEEEEAQEPPYVELELLLGWAEFPFGAPPFGPARYDDKLEVRELEPLLAQRIDRLFRITRVDSRDLSTGLTTMIHSNTPMSARSLSRFLGEWRSLLCEDGVFARYGVFARDGVRLYVSRGTAPHPRLPTYLALRHCGELQVDVYIATDAAVVAKRLGELLRVVALTTASHVDPSVFNALWDENGLCPMGASRCPRCDASDRHDSRPILRLAVQGQYRIRSGVGILHDAIYNWDEATDSSAEYKQLREMLHIEEEEAQEPPYVELELLLDCVEFPFGAPPSGPARYDDKLEVRELKALLAQRNDRLFRITRVESSRYQSTSLPTTILNAGVGVKLAPFLRQGFSHTISSWQWLFDWARRSAHRPVRVYHMAIVDAYTVATLVELLKFARIQCGSLDVMTLHWSVHSIREDAAQKRRALEAIGATLFAPSTRVEIQELNLDLGVLTDHDVAVLAECVRARGDDTTGTRTVPVVRSVYWQAPHWTAELPIQQLMSLFGAVGVRELEINNYSLPGLSCRTLKTVLESCPELTKLAWGVLKCDDFSELTDATWSSDASRLCALSVTIPHGNAASVVSAMDALLARVGMQLKGLQVRTVVGQTLSAPIADVIGARCPQLQELKFGDADVSFHNRLVQLFDEGRCGGVVELSIKNVLEGPNAVAGLKALLHALKNRQRAVTRTLRHLKLHLWGVGESMQEEVIRSLCETLSANLVLRHAVVKGSLSDEEKAQFQLLPRQFVTILPSIRRRLALLSVTQAWNSRLVKLPPDTLAAIFEFAGRRTRRYAHVDD